ncbi:MAG: thioesterase family protein [Ferruginibacter sp.]
MARLKLQISGKSVHQVHIPVRITEINYGNHTGNDALVGIIHEARVNWLHQQQFTELNIDGIALIMADLCIVFKNESFYGDVLQVEIFADEITAKSFELFYNIITTRNQSTLTVAIAKTSMLGFDYKSKKIVELSPALLKMVQ